MHEIYEIETDERDRCEQFDIVHLAIINHRSYLITVYILAEITAISTNETIRVLRSISNRHIQSTNFLDVF